MNKTLGCLVLFGLFLYACTNDHLDSPYDDQIKEALGRIAPTGTYDYYQFPESGDLAAIPNQEFINPITAGKVELGKMLFHETGLAASAAYPVGQGTYSCASCHIASAGFTPGRPQGLADGGLGFEANRQKLSGYEGNEVDAQGVRPLSVLNVAYVTNTLWSGIFGARGINEGTEEFWDHNPLSEINHLGLEGIEAQNIEGMELHRMEINEEVLDELGYRAFFDACFPEIPVEERYNNTTASFALGAYLRTLFANEAPFQKWLGGQSNALTSAEKRGALLFLGKARCFVCHNGPSFNAVDFHALGTKDLYEHADALNTGEDDQRNLGRGFFTGETEDAFKFKVPQLYNLKDYSHYFHGSSKTTLREVIDYKIKAEAENELVSAEQLSSSFRPIDLTEKENADLLVFLENGLRDPNLERYVPEEVLSGNCFPNNDLFSRIELGCD